MFSFVKISFSTHHHAQSPHTWLHPRSSSSSFQTEAWPNLAKVPAAENGRIARESGLVFSGAPVMVTGMATARRGAASDAEYKFAQVETIQVWRRNGQQKGERGPGCRAACAHDLFRDGPSRHNTVFIQQTDSVATHTREKEPARA